MEARERVKTCGCCLMGWFIALLALTVLGMFSEIG